MPQEVNPPVLCSDQSTVAPVITCVEGVKNFKKMQAIQVVTGQQATINYTMRDANGDPVNLAPCLAAGGSLKLKIREATVGMDSNLNSGVTIDCLPVDIGTQGADGVIGCQLTSDSVQFPGISKAEFGLLDIDGNLLFSNEIFLVVNRGQFAAQVTPLGPPTIPEIRLHLRDSDPSDNLWLGVEEFDMAEIAACIERPIHYFNEAPPPLNIRYNTSNFPSRYFYLEAIVGCLYQMATLHYARTHLPYQQQAGLVIDDKNKAPQYAELGKQRWEDWKNWVRHKKIQINASAAFQVVGSDYAGSLWR